MKKAAALPILFLALLTSQVLAQEPDFGEVKSLIDSGVSCDKVTDEQLEEIGDYYMEQMHPGEAHEIMDNMMGGEGSESLKQVHIKMARRLYCNENLYIGYGMMGGGVMPMTANYYGSSGGYGMMGQYGTAGLLAPTLTLLLTLAIVALAAAVTYWLIKSANRK